MVAVEERQGGVRGTRLAVSEQGSGPSQSFAEAFPTNRSPVSQVRCWGGDGRGL